MGMFDFKIYVIEYYYPRNTAVHGCALYYVLKIDIQYCIMFIETMFRGQHRLASNACTCITQEQKGQHLNFKHVFEAQNIVK